MHVYEHMIPIRPESESSTRNPPIPYNIYSKPAKGRGFRVSPAVYIETGVLEAFRLKSGSEEYCELQGLGCCGLYNI